ncbi:MAG: hypothetical protein MZV65_52300 [Chromatiales bacterium]|nr:hypothetical protein [Chromatiales bacterium]
MASQLKARDEDIKAHSIRLVGKLDRMGLVRGHVFEPGGCSRFLRADVQTVTLGNAFLVGDSAGLATRDMCEGIGPAVFSAASGPPRAIAGGRPYTLDGIPGASPSPGRCSIGPRVFLRRA